VVIFVLQFFIGAFNEDYQISEDIRNGLINQFLLKPINYFAYRLSVFAAARVVSGALGRPGPRSWPCRSSGATSSCPTTAGGSRSAIPAMGLTALIQFSIAYCFGLLAFWFLEIQGFVILSMAVETVLGGQFFPLDLLPPAVFHAVQLPALLLPGLFPDRHPHRPYRPRRRAARASRSRPSGPL
jgi:ABC-2 type transport system permease protein